MRLSFHSEKSKRYQSETLIVLALLLANLVIYSGALGNDFLMSWDDNLYVTDNPDIQSLTLANFAKIFSSFYVGNYAPVQMLSYMLDYQLWGLNPFGYILHNVLLNGCNVLLFYILLRVLGVTVLPSLVAAALFMVHPVQVESVAWVSQRKNLLAMFFFLQAFLFYHFYATGHSRKWLLFGLANVAFFLALMAKSVAVVLPVVLVAYDFLMQQERMRLMVIFWEKTPFILMAAAFAGLALVSQDPELGGGVVKTYHGGSAYVTFLTMLTVYRDYLVNILWPVNLSASYGPEIVRTINLQVIISFVLLLTSLSLPLFFRKRLRKVGFFWVTVFFVGLVPISQIVPLVTLMNDRYLYFPMLGVAGLVAAFLQSGIHKQKLVKAISLVAFLMLTLLTVQRTTVWANRLSLWQDATVKQDRSDTAWYALGLTYDDMGDMQSAVEPYKKALSISPDRLDVLYNLSLVYIVLGQFDEAQPLLEHATRVFPGRVDVLTLAGHNYFFRNNLTMARILYSQALTLETGSATIFNYLSYVENLSGNTAKSEEYWQKALQLGESPSELYLGRARLESLARKAEPSLMYLALAVETGIDTSEKVCSDSDLEFISNLVDFMEITKCFKE